MLKKNHLVYAAIALTFAAAGAWVSVKKSTPASSSAAPAAVETASPVDALFQQQLKDAKGVQQALAQWKGKALVVNFWAPWCGPCVEEMPELSVLQGELRDKNPGDRDRDRQSHQHRGVCGKEQDCLPGVCGWHGWNGVVAQVRQCPGRPAVYGAAGGRRQGRQNVSGPVEVR